MSALWGRPGLDISSPVEEYYARCATGTLPSVSYVDPYFAGSAGEGPGASGDEHPHGDVRMGQAYMADVVHAFMESPQFERGALFVVYDEWGGFYDHVVPKRVPDVRNDRDIDKDYGLMGFRIPSLVVSPYARRGHVAHSTFGFESILKMIEYRFGLRPLTRRDAYATQHRPRVRLALGPAPRPARPPAAGARRQPAVRDRRRRRAGPGQRARHGPDGHLRLPRPARLRLPRDVARPGVPRLQPRRPGLPPRVMSRRALAAGAAALLLSGVAIGEAANRRPTQHADHLFGTAKADRIDGLGGNDHIFGRGGDDVLRGGRGNDRVVGAPGDDVVRGGPGRDKVNGGAGDDVVAGGPGNDILVGKSGDDLVTGGSGDDRIYGSAGHDELRGGAGNDVIDARDGEPDRIDCGPGDDDTAIVDATEDGVYDCEDVQQPAGTP